MVNIVVGSINQGKTTKLIEIYEKLNKGDGFVSMKKLDGNNIIGYDALHLSKMEKYPFILKKEYIPENWENHASLESYRFSENTLNIIEEKIDCMIKKSIYPIFLDEIGVLELEGYGFDKILKKVLAEGDEIYVAIRDKFVERIIEKYSITDKNIITLN